MGTITVVDKNGAPAWGVPIRLGTRGSQPFDANTFEEKHIDRAGHIDMQFAALGICTRLAFDPKTQLWTVHVNYNEGFNPGWQALGSKSVDLGPDNLLGDAGASISLPGAAAGGGGGTQPPTTSLSPVSNGSLQGMGTVAEWKPIAHKIVSDNHLTIMEPPGGPQPNMHTMDAELKKVHPKCFLQFDSGGNLKPRIFLPVLNATTVDEQCARPIDIGDFGKPFFHGAGGTDEWVPTGRPPGTEW